MLESISFDESLIILDLHADNNQVAIQKMARNLVDNNCVYPSYVNAIWQREQKYSTGLPGTDFSVAIPHADPEHVIKDSISIAVLNKPIIFKMMGSNDIDLETEMIFMLAIKNGENQIALLQALMELFQHENALNQLRNASNKTEMMKLFKKYLNGKEDKE